MSFLGKDRVEDRGEIFSYRRVLPELPQVENHPKTSSFKRKPGSMDYKRRKRRKKKPQRRFVLSKDKNITTPWSLVVGPVDGHFYMSVPEGILRFHKNTGAFLGCVVPPPDKPTSNDDIIFGELLGVFTIFSCLSSRKLGFISLEWMHYFYMSAPRSILRFH